MVQKGALIAFLDNAGFATAKCLHVYRHRRLGALLLVVVRQRILLAKVPKKKLFHGVLVSQKSHVYRSRGAYYIRFTQLGAVTVNREQGELGTPETPPVLPLELLKSSFMTNAAFRFIV